MIRNYNPYNITKIYDYIIVGAGLTGATLAEQLTRQGYSVCVLEKESFVGGNCYTEEFKNIDIHKFGAHIFRTNSKEIWDYVNSFHKFHHFMHKVLVNYEGKLYSFPINLLTLHQLHPHITDPYKAHAYLTSSPATFKEPKNLEEQAINLVGPELYQIFIKGYTEKQWNKDCKDLPPSIIKRIPIRFTANDNYFPDNMQYQGIPNKGGYTELIKKMLEKADVWVNAPLGAHEDIPFNKKIFYTGPIDELLEYKFGPLQWRGLRFENRHCAVDFFQGVPVVNYTDIKVPYTRIIEHKHFDLLATKDLPYTIVTYEFPNEWQLGDKPYYPINTEENNKLHCKYLDELAKTAPDIVACGRLGGYAYYDMDGAIKAAFELVKNETGEVVL